MKNFEISSFYTIDEIRSVLGGPLLASIATKDNEILYVKFKKEKLNPNLPKEIWIKKGPIQYKSALSWVSRGEAVPMFFKDSKQGHSKWMYLGFVKVKIKYESEAAVKYTNCDEVSLVLEVV